MKKYLLKFHSYGKITVEKSEGGNPYLVREMKLEEPGEFPFNKFFGTVCGDDALLDLRKGDLVEVDIIFSVRKSGKKWQQELHFTKVKKINDLKDLGLW